jgi:hypothetical protein
MKKTPTKRRKSKKLIVPKPSATAQPAPQGDEPRLRPDQTPPLYPVTHEGNDVLVCVPQAVCEFGQARIIAREWGPDNNRIRGKGWAYWLVDSRATSGLGRSFVASEEEVTRWQR